MSRSIDERIVQMTFNNKDFEKNANQTIGTLDKLKSSLDFSGTSNSLSSVEKTINGFNFGGLSNAIDSIKVGFSALEVMAITALSNITNKAVDAGISLVKSLSIGQIFNGWNKFNAMIASEQTLMSAVEGKINEVTGEVYNMDSIIERIEKLQWYTDETSYSIEQMTTAIGSFTSSGVDLDIATQAILGIANACADAGVSTEKAQSAFEGMAKAIGSGKMTLSVWNNQLKSSGLINSERFKESILDAAAAEGTLTKEIDASGKALYRFGNELISTANMTEYMNGDNSLFSKDVLINALKTYSDTADSLYSLVSEGKIDTTAPVIENLTKALEEHGKTLADYGLDKEYDTTSEAIKALTKAYTEMGLEVPKSLKAFRRAQEAISLSQAVESVRGAVATSWAISFETIFGNYEEGRKLWTDVANDMWSMFAEGGTERNDILKDWKKMWTEVEGINNQIVKMDRSMEIMRDGEPVYDEESLNQIQATWRAMAQTILAIKDNVGEILSSVFGSISAEDIYNFVESIRNKLWEIYDWVNQTNGETTFQDIKNIIEGISNALKTIVTIIKQFNSTLIAPLTNKIKPVLKDILDIFGNLGKLITNSSTNIRNNMYPIADVFNNIYRTLEPIIDFLGSLIKKIKEFTQSLVDSSDKVEGFTNKFSILSTIGGIISKAFSFARDTVENFGSTLEKIKNFLSPLWEKIKEITKSIGNTLTSPLGESGISPLSLAGILVLLQKGFDFKWNLFDPFTAVIGAIKNVFVSIGETVDYIMGAVDAFSIKSFGDAFKGAAEAMLMMAGALLIIASIDQTKLLKALGVLTGMMTLFASFIIVLKKFTSTTSSFTKNFNTKSSLWGLIAGKKDGTKSKTRVVSTNLMGLGTALLEIAGSLLIVAGAMKILSNIEPDKLVISLGAILIVMYSLTKMIEKMGQISSIKGVKSKVFDSMGKSIKALALSLLIISAALKVMSTIDNNQLIIDLLAMAGILTAIGIFISQLSTSTMFNPSLVKAIGPAILGIGAGLLVISAALAVMALIPTDKLFLGLLAVAGVFTVIGVFASALADKSGNFVAIAAGLLIIAPALLIFAAALGAIALIPADKLGAAFLIISGLLLAIGVFASVIAPLSTSFLAIAGSILMLSAGFLAFSIGVDLLATAIYKLIPAMLLFESMGSTFSKSIGLMIVDIAAVIIAALPNLVIGIAKGLLEAAENLIGIITQIFAILGKSLEDNWANFVNVIAMMISDLLVAVIQIVDNLIDPVVNLLKHFIMSVLEGIKEIVPEVVSVLYDILVAFIRGVTAVLKNSADFFEAVGELVAAIGEALFKGIGSLGKGLFGSIADLFSGDDKKAEQAAENTGSNTAGSIMDGIMSKLGDVTKTTSSVLTTSAKDAQTPEVTSAFGKAGDFSVDGLLGGLLSDENKNRLKAAGLQEYLWVEEGYQSGADQHSPSRKMMKNGRFTIQGLLNGLKAMEPKMREEGAKLYDVLDSALDLANGMDDEFTPVITPVLDLSNIDPNAVSNALGTSSLNGAMSISSGLNAANQNGANNPVNLTLNTSFNVNTNQEITKSTVQGWASWIADSLNEELGRRLR